MLQKLKEVYLIWYGYYRILPKLHRHSLGVKIDKYFVDIIEIVAFAGFLKGTNKAPHIQIAIKKLETLNILLIILWETRTLDDKKYISLAQKLDGIGKNLGGWHGNIQKLQKKTP